MNRVMYELRAPPPTKARQYISSMRDFRQLNEKTLTDTYPIPHLRYFNSKLNVAKVFSKVDLTKAYHQIPIK